MDIREFLLFLSCREDKLVFYIWTLYCYLRSQPDLDQEKASFAMRLFRLQRFDKITADFIFVDDETELYEPVNKDLTDIAASAGFVLTIDDLPDQHQDSFLDIIRF